MSRGDARPPISIQWGHLALLLTIAAIVVAYWLDARATSLRPNNLMLVQPASLLALALVLAVLPQCFVRRSAEAGEDGEDGESLGDLGRVGALAACFGAFAIGLERVGFDVSTFLFMAAALWLCGERRWWVVLGFSAIFTALLIWGYGALIPFPFPLAVL